MKTVCVLGKGSLAIMICRWFRDSRDYHLAEICTIADEPDWDHSLAAHAAEHWLDIKVWAGEHEHLEPHDLAFSVFYDRILPADWISQHGRALNLHNGPLPRYRGVNPINWALRNGERVHGVTIHELTDQVDAGPIVARLEYPIWPEIDEVEDVYTRALEYGWTLFHLTMPLLDRIVARRQRESEATTYRREDAARLGDRAGWRRDRAAAA